MLRTLVFTLVLVIPGVAAAQQRVEQFPESAVGIPVRGDDSTVVGHVDAVERDGDGRVVAVEIAGLEPGNAPYASADLVAQSETSELSQLVNLRNETNVIVGNGETRTR